jgi:hypothetical protein
MFVTDIEISHYRYDPYRGRHCANVAFSTEDSTVNLYCQIPADEEEDADTRALGLLGEATRQLRQMPDIRSGRQDLQFAGHLGLTN